MNPQPAQAALFSVQVLGPSRRVDILADASLTSYTAPRTATHSLLQHPYVVGRFRCGAGPPGFSEILSLTSRTCCLIGTSENLTQETLRVVGVRGVVYA